MQTLIQHYEMKHKGATRTALMLIVLTSFAIPSCKQENAPEVDPLTLPSAQFFYEIQYRTYTDGNTYAYVTATNNSANSNRWEWNRPNSRWEISGDTKFMTDKDTAVTQVYALASTEQKFTITLVAYSDVVVNPDSTITFTSRPFVREVKVRGL